MKKLLLLLLSFNLLTTSNNYCYASFPVSEKMLMLESQTLKNNNSLRAVGVLSLIFGVAGITLMLLQGLIDPHAFIAGYFLLGGLLLIVSFILFVIWTTNKKWAKWFWITFIALGLLGQVFD